MKRKTSAYRASLKRATPVEVAQPRQDTLCPLANYLKERYYDHLQFYVELATAEPTSPDKAEDKVWLKLASLLVSKLIPPLVFIVAQFPPLGVGFRSWIPRTPRQLLGSRCFRRYETYAENAERLQSLRVNFNTQIETVNRNIVFCQDHGRVSVAAACEETICDDTLELTPLVRYCLARNFAKEYRNRRKAFGRIAATYEKSAAFEFITQRKLIEQTAMHDLLPNDFVTHASRIYREIFLSAPDCNH